MCILKLKLQIKIYLNIENVNNGNFIGHIKILLLYQYRF